MDVAVTGSGGLVGRRLVTALAEDPAVDRVVALDVVEQRVPAGVATGVADVRDPAIGDRFEGVDALVHLAFQLDPIQDEEAMRAINVDGTRTTLQAAVDAGVTRIVVASSASVYGAHPDNDVPLTESSPRRPPAEFSYARHKGEVEDWLWGWAGDLSDDVTVTVLRPAIVAGPGVDNFITRQLELPRMVTVAGHRPPMQVVHVDDVVEAFRLAATTDLPGAFNVAAPGWLSLDEALAKVREIVEEMKGVGPLATMMTKQSINRGVDMTLQQGFMQEADLAYMLSWSDDRQEGLRAFSERRKPDFKGQ